MDEVKGTIRHIARDPGNPILHVYLREDLARGNKVPHFLHTTDPDCVWMVEGEFQTPEMFAVFILFGVKANTKVTLHPITERYGVSLRAEFEDSQ